MTAPLRNRISYRQPDDTEAVRIVKEELARARSKATREALMRVLDKLRGAR